MFADSIGMKMKLLLLCIGTLLAAEESWIQVLSLKKEASVAPALLQRIEQNGFSYEVVQEGDAKKVRLGSFVNDAEAKSVLPLVRCKIASDAFVVRGVSVPAVEVVPEAVAVVANGPKKEGQLLPVEKASEPVKTEVKEEEKASEPCVCICDKKAYRKAEISAVMEFYRNSPDYRFSAPETD